MKRDHSREHKVKEWKKTNHSKWRRFVGFFTKLRQESRWKDTNMSFNDAVDEFELKEVNNF